MNKEENIVVILAEGFEEAEAVITIDLLRRLDFPLVVAGLAGRDVTGSHGIRVKADVELKDVNYLPRAVVLPGGMPGSAHLRDSQLVMSLVKQAHAQGRIVAALCAAPIALYAAGVTDDKTLTSHPSVKDVFANATHTGRSVERDGNLVTGLGPGASFEFAAAVAAALGKELEAKHLLEAMFVKI